MDQDGKPLVVYRRDDENFTVFDFDKTQKTDAGWLGKGFYFYGDQAEAERAYGYGKNLRSFYLKAENPYYISQEEYNELVNADDKTVSAEFTQRLIEDGYDSVYWNGDLRQEWVVFEPTQIKSATDNVGTFDPANPDIRFSVAEEERAQRWAEILLPVVSSQHIIPSICQAEIQADEDQEKQAYSGDADGWNIIGLFLFRHDSCDTAVSGKDQEHRQGCDPEIEPTACDSHTGFGAADLKPSELIRDKPESVGKEPGKCAVDQDEQQFLPYRCEPEGLFHHQAAEHTGNEYAEEQPEQDQSRHYFFFFARTS